VSLTNLIIDLKNCYTKNVQVENVFIFLLTAQA
jgi:hypothetical protein